MLPIILSGCNPLRSYSDLEYVERAKGLQSKGDLDAAIIELKNALQKNNKNAEARWLLGDLYLLTGQGTEAEKELKHALGLGINPQNLKISMGRALLLQGEFKRVLAEIQLDQKSSEKHVSNIQEIRGNAYLSLGQPNEGCPLFRQILDKDAAFIPAYLGMARCAAVLGNLEKAKAEIDKALKLDNANSDSWKLLGDLERVQGHANEAESAYTQAIKAKPNNFEALLGRAMARIQSSKLDSAKEDVASVSRRYRDHPALNHLNGVIHFKEKKLTDARTSFQTALKIKPDYVPSVLWLGLTHLALRNYEQALQQFSQYDRMAPGSPKVRALEAFAQAKLGEKEEATKTLQNLDSAKLDDPETLMLLGQAHMAIGESDLGSQYFSKAVEQMPEVAAARAELGTALAQQGESAAAIKEWEKALQLDPHLPGVDERLIQALMKERRFDEALKAIDAFQGRRPDNPAPENYRGGVLLMRGNEEGAQQAFAKALEIKPGYPPAAHNLALLAVRKKDLESARNYYQRVLVHEKHHLSTLLALYKLELGAKRAQEARRWLEVAVNSHPKAPEPVIFLAQDYLNRGEPLKALEISRAASNAHPTQAGLLEVSGLAYLASADTGNALTTFKRLIQAEPKSAQASFYLASAHAALGDISATRAALIAALKLDAKHINAKIALARLELGAGKSEDARRQALELQKLDPSSPEGAIIEAESYAQEKKLPEAIRILEAAQKKDYRDRAPIVLFLAQKRLAAGNSAVALASVVDWQKSHPTDVRASKFLGDAYLALGRDKEAAAEFEKVLKLVPNHADALNNVAWLVRKENPERALHLAQTAVKLSPKSANYLDTLGWILVDQGNTARGLEVLKGAAGMAPKNPEIRYHLAAALAKSGDKRAARRELEQLLASNPKFRQADEAKALLRQI